MRILSRITTAVAIFLVASFSLIAHTTAMPLTSHSMHATKHSVSTPINCATLCANNAYNKDESVVTESDDEEDDFPVQDHVSQQTIFMPVEDAAGKAYANTVKPPSKVPIYIRHGVLRV